MNKTQWIVLGVCFIFGTYLFGNYYAGIWSEGGGITGMGYAQDYEVLSNFTFFLSLVCFIMAVLEPKQKLPENDEPKQRRNRQNKGRFK